MSIEEPNVAGEKLTGAEFKKQLRAGQPKMGLFLNSHSATVAEQLAHSGYDWLLVDTQHGPMGFEKLSAMLGGIASGGAKSLVRVEGYHDRGGIQQALDLGADGVIIPYMNTAEIAAIPGVDILFLGQTDLCMSMGLYEKYEFPLMYTSPELNAATQSLVEAAHKNDVILGLFLFGTSRVGEFLDKGFSFISIGNDLHHVLTQSGAHVADLEKISKEKGKLWTRRPTALF